MRSEHFEQGEALLLVFLLLRDQGLNKFLQLGLLRLRYQRFLEQNLIDQAVNVRPWKKCSQSEPLLNCAIDIFCQQTGGRFPRI